MIERDQSLDIAKGILIIMMITGHVFLEGPLRHLIYTFHMPAFLIITGILTAKSSSMDLSLS